jgi:pyruvate/2-oxoglutarate dehydrogenase complex dihydrolipoamide acyltransferase (E2) component
MKEIVMPQFGETSEEEIRIVKWLKRRGDFVAAGEQLLEVETEKANLTIEAAYSGKISSIVKEAGEVVRPGEVIAYIE